MAEQLKLTIEIGGVDKAYRNVNELVKIIKEAENTLKTGTFSNKAQFTQLGDDISQARKLLRSLKKEGADLRPPAALEDFADFGQFVTSSFGLATSAIELFGGKSEDVARAAAKAQQLLTFAYTAQQTAVGLVRLRTVALAVAQGALTISTNVTNKALKALFLTISTNPMTALLTVAGLLVGVLLSLTGATEKAETAEEKYQKTLAKTNDEREFQLDLLREQGATEKELSQIRINNATDDLRAARARLNVLIRERASQTEQNKELKIIAESKKILIKEEAKLERMAREELEKGEKDTEANRKKRSEERKTQIESEIAALGELTRAEITRNLSGKELDPIEFNNQLEKRLKLIEGLVEGYKSEETALEKYKNTLGDVYYLQNADYDEKKKIELQLLALGQATGLYNNELGMTREVLEQTMSSTDRFGNVFNTSMLKGIKTVISGIVGGDPITTVVKLDQRLLGVYNTLTLISSGFKDAGSALRQVDLFNIVRVLQGFEEGDSILIDQVIENRNKLSTFQEQFVADYVKNNLKVSTSDATYAKSLEETTKSGQVAFALILENTKNFVGFERATFKAAGSVSELSQKITDLARTGPALNAFLSQNRDLITDSLSVDVTKFSKNARLVEALNISIRTKQFESAEGFATDILDLETQLLQQGIDIRAASDEEKLKLLQAFAKKQIQITTETETETEKIQKERIDRVLEYIQNIQSVLNSLGQTTQDFFQLQFDRIEREYAGLQDSIIGDTEKANALRLKSEEDYQTQRKTLEKRAAITQLSISLGQSIANTAEAITKAYAQFGAAGFIPAAIVAGLTAVQTGIITAQIANISRYQKGGVIEFEQVYKKGQGGLVVGPSHEMGGVKYQQGGVELEGGESVINRVSSVRYQGLLSEINQAGGGRPLVMNNFDDSRIVEAIARQRKEPLRAYVLESDITEKQAVTKRLEQLSQI